MAVYDENGVGVDHFRTEYWHTDHLGNVRLAFSDVNNNGRIEIEDDPGTPEDDTEIMRLSHTPYGEIPHAGWQAGVGKSHYYPFGMNQMGPWYETVVPSNKYQYNGKELNEELGLDWYDYGARWYDGAVGRFTGVDPIADQFPNLSNFNYANNNPITNIDLHGLQGLHYMETLPNGTKRHVLEKNVIVLTQAPRQIPADASERKVTRIERQNRNRLKSNERTIEETKSKIEPYFSDAKNSKGESVRFKFNYIEVEVDNPGKIGRNEARELAIKKHGIEGQPLFDGGPNDIAPAVVVQDNATLQSQGDGIRVEADDKIPGALAHEVGHTFMRRGQKLEENPPGKGGLMGDPPGLIKSHEVDKMLEDAVKRKN